MFQETNNAQRRTVNKRGKRETPKTQTQPKQTEKERLCQLSHGKQCAEITYYLRKTAARWPFVWRDGPWGIMHMRSFLIILVCTCVNVQMQHLPPREVRATAREELGTLKTLSKLITTLPFKPHMLMNVTQLIRETFETNGSGYGQPHRLAMCSKVGPEVPNTWSWNGSKILKIGCNAVRRCNSFLLKGF